MVGTMALNPPRALHEAVQRDLAALAEWAGTRGWTVLFSPHERNPLAPPPPRRDTARSGSVGDTASHHRGPGRARPQANGCPRAGRKRRALPVTLRLARCVARLRPRGFSLNPYRPGDFVWSHYPLSENPARPGPAISVMSPSAPAATPRTWYGLRSPPASRGPDASPLACIAWIVTRRPAWASPDPSRSTFGVWQTFRSRRRGFPISAPRLTGSWGERRNGFGWCMKPRSSRLRGGTQTRSSVWGRLFRGLGADRDPRS